MIDDRHYTVKEVANKLNVQEQTIRKWIKDGRLPAVKLNGTTIRIPEDDFHNFYLKNKSGGWSRWDM